LTEKLIFGKKRLKKQETPFPKVFLETILNTKVYDAQHYIFFPQNHGTLQYSAQLQYKEK
jgi:hypothetical protein